ncbi:MAG: class I SAM-dependent methyltransferase [Terriglobus roseus]|nr:class I SAM-dependent methyltransferase [Terriglobus roseus]
MDPSRGTTAHSSESSSHSLEANFGLQTPFTLMHGRRYLRDLPYPLPCDLLELQRQNLFTHLATSIFGTPICCPSLIQRPPRRVLEVACGSGYWSSLCHELFSGLGHPNVEFVGLDIVSVAPNLSKHGMNWRFVQHDLREVPLPFDDGDFDLVLLKDLSIVVPMGIPSDRMLDEALRVLRPGGTLEWWENDYQLRTLMPHPRPSAARHKRPSDLDQAITTGTFVITPATPFAARVENKYLQEYNMWVQRTMDKRLLAPTPCSRISPTLLQEPDSLTDIDFRRLAVPLGSANPPRDEADGEDDEATIVAADPNQTRALDSVPLTEEQMALRQTALQIVVQLIESLEPLLKESSGKSGEEWARWWTWMMADLLENAGASNGECLEIGAWWAKKL